MSNDRPRIALLVHTPLRDLPGLALTAFELCQRGATCYLMPQESSAGFAEIFSLAPDFVLLPGFRPYYVPKVRMLMEAGIQYGLMDTEGGVFFSPDYYFDCLWQEPELNRNANCIAMWGDRLTACGREKGVFSSGNTFVTGCPRFDFYSQRFTEYSRRGVEADYRSERKMVLINTNFTFANSAHVPRETCLAVYERDYGHTREEVLRWLAAEEQAIVETASFVRRLAYDFPEVDFILRPHPEEKVEPYTAEAGTLPNVRVLRSGPVCPWIMRASAVIQRSCTTAIEAGLAGIPALSPQWVPIEKPQPLCESVSVPCAEYADLKDAVAQAVSGRFQVPAQVQANIDGAVRDWFSRIDGMAHQRLADTILKTLKSGPRPNERTCRKFLHGLHQPGAGMKKIGKSIRYALGLPPEWSFRQSKARSIRELSTDCGVAEAQAVVDGAMEARRGETLYPVRVTAAHDADAYIVRRPSGSTLVMQAPEAPSVVRVKETS